MRIRTRGLLGSFIILIIYALLGNLNIFDIQKVLADKNTSNGQYDMGNSWIYPADSKINQSELAIIKNATPSTYDSVGDLISYSYVVTISGDPLAGPVVVSDDKATDEDCPNLNSVGNHDRFLDPDESITCTATYNITQADLNAGSVINIAYASADGTNSPTDTETVTAIQLPALTMVKTATPAMYDSVGDVISYNYLVTNSGNVRLAGPVAVSDDKATNETCPDVNTVGNMDGYLDPDESITCTATYNITQADLNAGSVTNSASASAYGTNSPVDTETVTAIQSPALSIIKTASPTVYDYAGQVISYSFKVENTGNVTLNAPFIVFDDKTANEECPLTPTSLNPGEFVTCTASYIIQLSDMSSGTVINSAYATGMLGETTITSNPDIETITAKKILTYTFLPLVAKPYPIGVQILPVSYYYEYSDRLFIIGEVLNNTSDTLAWVKVSVNIYNDLGKLVGTKNIDLMPTDLPAMEKGCFKIDMPLPANWAYYQFEDPTYSVGDKSSDLSIINDNGSYNSPNYRIIGQVRNDGNQRSYSVTVSGTLYNASGVPVGCSYAKVNSNDLNPGQISSFSIEYWYFRDYYDVDFYRLRVAGELP